MSFICGVNQGQKQFDFHQTVVCPRCGRYGRYEVFMTYLCLSLFFLPVLKWNRRYFVRTSCCGAVYALNPEKGRAIAHGEPVTIEPQDLTLVGSQAARLRRCPRCGYTTEEDFTFCPKCGSSMEQNSL